MKINKTIVGMAVLTLILTAGVVSVSAYQGDYTKMGPNSTSARHEAITAAFESDDYQAWAEQMNGRGRIAQIINEDNFARFAEAHRLGQAGDIAGADAIRTELGLRGSNGERMGAGFKGGNRSGMEQGERGGRGQGMRGSNGGGNFVDSNGDNVCDNLVE